MKIINIPNTKPYTMKNITLTIVTLLCMHINYAAETDFQKSIPQFFRNYAYFEHNFPENDDAQREYTRILEDIKHQDLSEDTFYKFILNYDVENYNTNRNPQYQSCSLEKNSPKTCFQVMASTIEDATAQKNKRNSSISPVEKSIEENNLKKLAWLMAISMPLNEINKLKMRPIHHAVMNDDTTALEMLLSAQVNIDAPTQSGFTPLHVASYYNKIPAMKILISQGAYINATTREKNTALHYAIQNKNLEAAKLLLASNAHIKPNIQGKTPIDCATTDEMIEVFSDSKIV